MTPPQLMSPVGHWHTPAVHAEPGGHWLPQPPQLLLSVCSLTQPRTRPQYVSPEPWAHWQLKPPGAIALAAQFEAGPQTVPHVPQFMFVEFDVHMPWQTICPVGHAVHWPFTQF